MWFAAANLAVGHIESIVKTQNRRRRNKSSSDGHGLSTREIEILQRRASLETANEVAAALGVTVHTVHAHLQSARTKLKTTDTTVAVVQAIRLGLVEI